MIEHVPVVQLSVPQEVAAGAELTCKASVSCPAGCDLSGGVAEVTGPGGVVLARVSDFTDGSNAFEEIRFKVPDEIGDYRIQLVLPRNDSPRFVHHEVVATATFRTVPHETSLAVWGPSHPAVVGRPFSMTVGVKCAESCGLGGHIVEVHDEQGELVARGTVRPTPEPNTRALHATELSVVAPQVEGVGKWSVRYVPSGELPPHRPAATTFTLRTVCPPDHALTIRVLEQATGEPIVGAEVRAGFYRSRTGAEGIATLELPRGIYEVQVSKVRYDEHSREITVTEDVLCEAVLAAAPEKDTDDDRVWM